MNIKISIKDCDCIPNVTNGREISEVEHKKRTMLYAPPENDKNTKQTVRAAVAQKQPNNRKQNINTNSQQYKQSQRQMLNELKKNGQNRVTVDMVQQSNAILQKQTEILEKNQKSIHDMVNNGKRGQSGESSEGTKTKLEQALAQMKKQISDLNRMKSQILSTMQQFKQIQKNQTQNISKRPNQQYPPHISQMHSNMKNQIQSHADGIGNMEAINNLQAFNMEGYGQAINTLKRQIAQLQKQSENIQRQLKIRSAKLQKLELPPKFQEQLYKPYQQHLNDRVKSIDLYAIRQRLYDRIGAFDYGKFEVQVNNIMAEAKNQLSNIPIIEKEHRILIPDIRIDQKQLKNMEIKLPSVLDEYKAARGIRFEDSKENKGTSSNQATGNRLSKTNQIQQRLKQTNTKKPPSLQRINTIPVDLARQVNLNIQNKKKTILENDDKMQKKQFQNRMKNANNQAKKYQDDFDKYLQNRAQQQLELLKKERQRKRMKKIESQEYEEEKNPTFISHDNNRKKGLGDQFRKKKDVKQKEDQQDAQQGQQQLGQLKKQPEGKNRLNKDSLQSKKQIVQQNKHVNIKQVGRQILKEKLKNLIGQKNRFIQGSSGLNSNIPRRQQINVQNGQRQIQNIAEGFINMINNTLTQVNNNLSRSIEKKIQQNHERKPGSLSLQKKHPNTIKVPELEAFRPPPVFNMNIVQQPIANPYIPSMPIAEPRQPKKIVLQNYDEFKIRNDDTYREYEISSQDEDDI